MKALRYALYAAGGIAVLVVIAVIAAVLVIDGAFVKSRLERQMKDEKQRTLKIEGTPALKLFPVFSLSLGKTSLSEPSSDKVFVSLDAMEVAVRVMPLLSRELVVEKLSLSGFKANVVRDKDGRMNFADLAGAKDGKPADQDEPPRLRLGEAKIERANIAFSDQATGQSIAVGDLNLTTGKLADDAPAPVALSMSVTGKKPDVALKIQLNASGKMNLAKRVIALSKLDARVSGNADTLRGLDLRITGDIDIDAREQEYNIDTLALVAKGTLDRDALTASFNAPKLRVTRAKAEGKAITGNLTVKGPGRNVDAKLAIAAVEGSAAALSIPSFTLDIDSNVAGNGMKGRITAPVKANLQARTWELAKIDANLTFSGPAVPQKTVTLPIQASLRADLGKQSADAELATKFDETSIKAKFGATRLEPLAATFDVAIDKLNLDRYIHPDKKDAHADDKIDLSGLKGKTVSGKFAAGALTVKRVKLENVKADIKLAGGKLEVAPHSANLYGGTLAGTLSADANGNRFTVKEAIHNVALGALLRDAAQKDVLDGRGNVDIDVQTVGTTVPALKKALAGSARVVMKEGAVKGINLAESFRNVKGALGSKSVQSDTRKQTDFSDMSASFAIKNGVAHNEDLKAAAPFARLGGAGDIDIGNNTINYTAKASLVATSKGQGGKAAGDVAGVTVPVKITGSLDNPSWSIDYTALAGSALGGVLGGAGAVGGAVGDTAKKGTGAVTDAVRGLFGRK